MAKSGYVGKIKNAGAQIVKAPNLKTEAKKGKVKREDREQRKEGR